MTNPNATGTEPDFDDFLTPIEPRKSRRVLISVIAGLTVLAMVGVTVGTILVFTSQDDSPAAPAESQFVDAAQRYVSAVNKGSAADYLVSVCAPLRDQFPNLTDVAPADPVMAVRAVTDVTISGNIATANVAIAPADQPDTTPRVDKLRFLDENGWNYCGPAQ